MEIFNKILLGLGYIYLVYTVVYSTILVIFVLLGRNFLYKKKKQRMYKNSVNESSYVPISIIVPAYNEEVTIASNVKSLLQLDYEIYEIIVVDDGSKDNTSKKMIEEFHMREVKRPIRKRIKCEDEVFMYETYEYKAHLTLIRKNNGGKADAINMGINVSLYPYFICMDADSVLQRDSLKEIASPILEDETIVAVGGSIRIINDNKIIDGKVLDYTLPKNITAAMQVVEYDRTFSSAKVFFNNIKANAIISGAFGLFKKETAIAVGGYDRRSIGEDMDLVISISKYCMDNKIPYKIDYVPQALCWTEGVEKLKELKGQRRRWHLGMKQVMWKNKGMLFNPKYKTLGLVTLPIFLFFELLSPVIEVFGFFGLIYSLIFGLSSIYYVILTLFLYGLFGVFSSLVAYIANIQTCEYEVRGKDVFKILLLCIYELVFMHFYLLFVRFIATFKSTKKKLKWGTIQRKGSKVE